MTCAACSLPIEPNQPIDRDPMGPVRHIACLPVFTYAKPTPLISAADIHITTLILPARIDRHCPECGALSPHHDSHCVARWEE